MDKKLKTTFVADGIFIIIAKIMIIIIVAYWSLVRHSLTRQQEASEHIHMLQLAAALVVEQTIPTDPKGPTKQNPKQQQQSMMLQS